MVRRVQFLDTLRIDSRQRTRSDGLMNGRWGYAVFADLVVQGAAADTEAPGGLFFVPLALDQGLSDQHHLVFRKLSGGFWRRDGRGARDGRR